MSEAVHIRQATADDRPAILDLLRKSLGRDDDERYEALYRWKHETNPFGRSYESVAVDDGQVIGFRAMMRWRYRSSGGVVRAVRAVDTATDPDHQGRGIFTRLTTRAVDDLRAEGVSFVFNTPNTQSRPGYLKMGWTTVGRVPIGIRPRSASGLVKIAQARVAADRWSQSCGGGIPIDEALADGIGVDALLASQPALAGLRTDRSRQYLQWRYGMPELRYRAVLGARGVSDGLLIGRVRRRGGAREFVVAELITPARGARAVRELLRSLSRQIDADYLLRIGGISEVLRTGFFPAPSLGPILTWRALCETRQPPMADWQLSMGDIELF